MMEKYIESVSELNEVFPIDVLKKDFPRIYRDLAEREDYLHRITPFVFETLLTSE